MTTQNRVFIATSLDGYIADANGGIEYLDSFPELNTIDTGWASFMEGVDAILMGRATFEKVLSFGIEWPYQVPVFVLSNSLTSIPSGISKNIYLVKGTLTNVLDQLHNRGHHRLYIDGGKTIQSFLDEDLIDEMIITTIPVVLGGGIPLFGSRETSLLFHAVESTVFLEKVVQTRYIRARGE